VLLFCIDIRTIIPRDHPTSMSVFTAFFSSRRRVRRFLALWCLAGLYWLGAAPGQAQSIARVWNEEILAAIRIDRPNPPVHARNLFHLAVAMYDCWAAYDTTAIGCLYHERATAPDIEMARREAISYAAYNILKSRYAGSLNAIPTMAALDARMDALGYDRTFTSSVGPSPAAVGNRIALTIRTSWGLGDGSNQQNGYVDVDGYVNLQPPMNVLSTGGVILGGIPAGTDPNRWQPLSLGVAFDQGGNPLPAGTQSFVGVSWLHTEAFSLVRSDPTRPWIDPGGPSKLGQAGDQIYKLGALEVVRYSSQLNDEQVIDISPGLGGMGNNSLGADDGSGRALNPVTGQPYAPQPTERGDFARVLAEFWADGPNSETPPGHWHVLANRVSDNPLTVKKIGGLGPVVGDLEWDVKLYMALSGATHNAACAAWSLKRYYEGVRPITMIRYMGSKGQSSDPLGPSYHPQGLPLEAGVVEVITAESSAPGQRHAGVGNVGEIAVKSWPGEPAVPATQISAVRWVRAVDWVPYQRKTFNTPGFPGFISGHSTFSRAAAEVLAAFTGSPFFPGGLGTFTATAGSYLVFEDGPGADVVLQWATYFDAADQAGQSRRWGGIHVPEDDYIGRHIGAECGVSAWNLARRYWDGSILDDPIVPHLTAEPLGDATIEWNSVRGLYYKLWVTDDLGEGHWGESMEATQARGSHMQWVDGDPVLTRRFFRVSLQATP
jgi:hypothetical protein